VQDDVENITGQETFSTTKDITRNIWARANIEKAHAFTELLAKVFQPHRSENEPKEEEALI
jgi:hypothetical protein